MPEDRSSLAVVPATPSEAPELAGVKDGYGPEDVAERFRWLRQDVEGTWLLLKASNDVIGWCVVVWSGKRTHAEYPDMQDLYIRPENRNRGHATRLIGCIERMARQRGHTMIGLAVNPDDNRAARRLYERLGYRHDGRPKYLDGVYGDYEDWVIDLEKQI